MNNKEIMLSIITVTYNAEKELSKTLDSIFSQSYDNYELIIIDGKSTDNTVEAIKKHHDRIDYWISEKDNGIYDAMNKALALARGEYIQFLNAGDFFFNNKVLSNLFSNIINHPTLIYGDIHVLGLDGKNFYQKAYSFTFNNLLTKGTGVLCHQAMFVNRKKAPLYNLRYRYKGELNWYFDLVEQQNFSYQYIETPVIYYRLGGFGHKNFIRNQINWLKLIYERYGIITIVKSNMIVPLLIDSISRYTLIQKIFIIIRYPVKYFKTHFPHNKK